MSETAFIITVDAEGDDPWARPRQITTRNAQYLPRCLESVLRQSVQPTEILVLDDASTDNKEELLRPFADRICYVRQDRGGPSAARNRGIL